MKVGTLEPDYAADKPRTWKAQQTEEDSLGQVCLFFVIFYYYYCYNKSNIAVADLSLIMHNTSIRLILISKTEWSWLVFVCSVCSMCIICQRQCLPTDRAEMSESCCPGAFQLSSIQLMLIYTIRRYCISILLVRTLNVGTSNYLLIKPTLWLLPNPLDAQSVVFNFTSLASLGITH